MTDRAFAFPPGRAAAPARSRSELRSDSAPRPPARTNWRRSSRRPDSVQRREVMMGRPPARTGGKAPGQVRRKVGRRFGEPGDQHLNYVLRHIAIEVNTPSE